MNELLGVIGSALLIVIGLWKYFGRKNEVKRQLAEQARKDLENAKKSGNPSDLLDAFGKLR